MPPVDMSPEAIAARLKLASELRDLCLLLGKAKIETKPAAQPRKAKKKKPHSRKKSK